MSSPLRCPRCNRKLESEILDKDTTFVVAGEQRHPFRQTDLNVQLKVSLWCRNCEDIKGQGANMEEAFQNIEYNGV